MPPTLKGAGVSPGAGYGPAKRLVRETPQPDPDARHGGDPAAEAERAATAMEETARDLAERGERAGGDAAEVLNAQALMARDPALADDVRSRVGDGASAARAVSEAMAVYRRMLADAGEYLAARVADLDDVRDRIVARLLEVPLPGVPHSDTPFVLVAEDLAPADTAMLDPELVVAFVTREGGPTSHTAILARSQPVPAAPSRSRPVPVFSPGGGLCWSPEAVDR